MATYNTVIKKRNTTNNGWDSILPITTAENVLINEQGDTVASRLADYTLQVPYAVATGTANNYAISLPITNLITGMAVTVKINVASTGACTLNWNGKGPKSIKKADGTPATNLKANGIYTLRYDGTSFQLQGEGGEYGDAQAGHVLAGKTFGTDNGLRTGTMPNNGTVNQTITSQGGQVNIPGGYYAGGVIKAMFNNLVASNIRKGVNVGGVTGAYSESITTFDKQIVYSSSESVRVDRGSYQAIIALVATSWNTLDIAYASDTGASKSGYGPNSSISASSTYLSISGRNDARDDVLIVKIR